MATRRLRSSTVVLGGVGVLAAMITSCGSEPDRRYGGSSKNGKVQGGSFDKSAVERGGFGCSGPGGG
ncbi:hypothetical protein PUR34_29035 [Streptomyces sp. JV185]|uniref:hypothetical protein n=1 Tax=Streptomyces sp. JV185 TaxID=858638 RepID=UPI002E78858F|nr:hypothetical protein [Streptomyces sp. JV185]MEE1772095.1 hypothetical protein [Streptomyces sp. JV185]